MFAALPSRRLVILGKAGSGKTVLALRLASKLLAKRKPDDPVPVVFNLSTWNPYRLQFSSWLGEQLLKGPLGKAAGGTLGRRLAHELVAAKRILPILDGFDEIPPIFRATALKTLNKFAEPLVLASRSSEYGDAVASVDVITAALVITIADLEPRTVAEYLRRASRPTPSSSKSWDTFEKALTDDPISPAAEQVAKTLATPLMLYLARTLYGGATDRKPDELLVRTRFTSLESIEDHLLKSYIPAIYESSDAGARMRSWKDANKVYRWHANLATHLHRTATQDLVWWEVPYMVPPTLRRILRGLTTGILVGLTFGLSAASSFTIDVTNILDEAVVILFAVAGGIAGLGLMLMTIERVAKRHGGHKQNGPTSRIWDLGQALTFELAGVLTGMLTSVLLAGLINGRIFGVIVGPMPPCPDGLCEKSIESWLWHSGTNTSYYFAQMLEFGLLIGLTAWLLSKLAVLTDRSPRIEAVPSPGDPIRISRNSCLLPIFVGLLSTVFQMLIGTSLKEAIGLLSVVLAAALYTKWGTWLMFARVWLPATGRLPWALIAFLEDARRLGVLRRAGGAYRYRHARLREQLYKA